MQPGDARLKTGSVTIDSPAGHGGVRAYVTRQAQAAAALPVVLVLADNDERIIAAWPTYEAALKTAGANFEAFKHPGTQHGFNNDTTPGCEASAAQQAWGQTIALFNQTLR